MFDIGSLELLIIAIVALIVIGPNRLPEVARKAGMWMGKINRIIANFKNDINREFKAEELKQTLQKQADVAGIHEIIEDTKGTFDSLKKDTKEALDELQSDAPQHEIEKIEKQDEHKP